MLGNLLPILPMSAITAGAIGAGAVFMARQIPAVEKVLDKGVAYVVDRELPIPHIANAKDGFPLGYVVAPLALAIAIHKFL